MPKWLVLRTLTHPGRRREAFSMAISLALGPMTRPSPLSPSTVATLGTSRMIRILGLGLMRPMVSMSK